MAQEGVYWRHIVWSIQPSKPLLDQPMGSISLHLGPETQVGRVHFLYETAQGIQAPSLPEILVMAY